MSGGAWYLVLCLASVSCGLIIGMAAAGLVAGLS